MHNNFLLKYPYFVFFSLLQINSMVESILLQQIITLNEHLTLGSFLYVKKAQVYQVR